MSIQKNNTTIGLKKAQSLIAKIIKMIDAGDYCIDIMQQNLAVLGLLRAVHQSLMENHLKTCFKRAMETKNENRKNEMINEILKVTNFFNK